MKLMTRCKSETRSWCGRYDGCTAVSSLSPTINNAKAMLFSCFPAMNCNVFDAFCRTLYDIGKQDGTLDTRKGPGFPSGPLSSSRPRSRLSFEFTIDRKSKPGFCRKALWILEVSMKMRFAYTYSNCSLPNASVSMTFVASSSEFVLFCSSVFTKVIDPTVIKTMHRFFECIDWISPNPNVELLTFTAVRRACIRPHCLAISPCDP
mmetsp:Transcript_1759/g.4105  ORF Transcript_1759/g.4105 Transcript_1759/m.4105 type:complete len:206 (-) Transcript_1759:275-892(-)